MYIDGMRKTSHETNFLGMIIFYIEKFMKLIISMPND